MTSKQHGLEKIKKNNTNMYVMRGKPGNTVVRKHDPSKRFLVRNFPACVTKKSRSSVLMLMASFSSFSSLAADVFETFCLFWRGCYLSLLSYRFIEGKKWMEGSSDFFKEPWALCGSISEWRTEWNYQAPSFFPIAVAMLQWLFFFNWIEFYFRIHSERRLQQL